ncbi:MAG: DUF58 domain-containing protein [Lachnospiraceae bacterium]|nr:DUF58 domain-containing protein [Lachnospiraceae bacterium]
MIRRFILYLIFICASIIWTILFECYELYLLTVVLIVMPFLMILLMWLSSAHLKVSHAIPKDKAEKGEKIPITINIDNKGFLPAILLKIKLTCTNELYNLSTEEIFEIPTLKRGKQSYIFALKSQYCGNIKITLNQIELCDYFGLFSIKKRVRLEKIIPVTPKLRVIEDAQIPVNVYVCMDGQTYSKNKEGDDVSEIFDIREYREGDELHKVHWKLSAKKDTLIVKELSLPLSSGMVIMMEMCVNNDDNSSTILDTIIDTVIAMSLYLQEREFVHYIAWHDGVSDKCSRIKVTPDMPISEIFANIYKSKIYSDGERVISSYNLSYFEEQQSHVYYISAVKDESLLQKLRMGRENTLLNYICVLLNEYEIDDEYTKIFEANDIKIQYVTCDNIDNTINNIEF